MTQRHKVSKDVGKMALTDLLDPESPQIFNLRTTTTNTAVSMKGNKARKQGVPVPGFRKPELRMTMH